MNMKNEFANNQSFRKHDEGNKMSTIYHVQTRNAFCHFVEHFMIILRNKQVIQPPSPSLPTK